jgi:hypothetical protein
MMAKMDKNAMALSRETGRERGREREREIRREREVVE